MLHAASPRHTGAVPSDCNWKGAHAARDLSVIAQQGVFWSLKLRSMHSQVEASSRSEIRSVNCSPRLLSQVCQSVVIANSPRVKPKNQEVRERSQVA